MTPRLWRSLLLILLLASPVEAAIAHVQTPAGGAANASAVDLPTAFLSNTTAGNAIVCGWRYSSSGRTVTMSDTGLNTWTSNAIEAFDATDVSTVGIGFTTGIVGGADTPNFHISGAAANLRVSCSEFSGVATTSALDKSAGTSGSSTAPASGSVTPTTNGQLFYASTHISALDTITAGTDFTITTTISTVAGNHRMGGEYYVQPTAAAHNGDFSTVNSNTWSACIITLKPTGAAAAATPTRSLLGVGTQ